MDDNKVALISGASSGIGEEFARQLSDQGWTVFLLARRKDKLEQICEQINTKNKGKAYFEVCDVGDRDLIAAAVERIYTKTQHLDLVIANAGVGRQVGVKQFDTEIIDYLYQVNVFGVLSLIKGVLPKMLSRGQGHIVAISSLAAYRAFPKTHPYCATKSALNAHMQGLYHELKPYNIAVTTICPGFIRTPMTRNNKFHMPLLSDVTPAVRKMLKAIERRKVVYSFPLPLYYFTRFLNLFPESFIAWCLKVFRVSKSL